MKLVQLLGMPTKGPPLNTASPQYLTSHIQPWIVNVKLIAKQRKKRDQKKQTRV